MIRIAVDTETTGLNPWKGATPFMVAVAYGPESSDVWEWPVDPLTRIVRWQHHEARYQFLKDLMRDPSLEKVFFNAAFDIRMLRRMAISVCGRIHEVQFKAAACDNDTVHLGLKELARRFVKIGADDERDLQAATIKARRIGKRLGWQLGEEVKADYWMPAAAAREATELWGKSSGKEESDACARYCARDAERTLLLNKLFDYGMDDLGVREVYDREMALWNITFSMTDQGVRVDPIALERCRAQCSKARDEALAAIVKLTGKRSFNPNAHAQVADALFGRGPRSRRLEATVRTQSGMPSTAVQALQDHKNDPLVRELLRYRANEKALGSFFDKFQELSVLSREGPVIHPGFKQWGTTTGRYACAAPNLQNVSDPKNSQSRAAEFVIDARQVFIPRRGRLWVLPDYKQVEVIIFADLSGEETLRRAILDGKDIHDTTTNRVWGGEDNPRAIRAVMLAAEMMRRAGEGKPDQRALAHDLRSSAAARRLLERSKWDVVAAEAALGAKNSRKRAKAVTFCKIYGGGPNALTAWIPGLSRGDAVEILRDYDRAFPQLSKRFSEIEQQARRNGFIKNPFGRRLNYDPHAGYAIVNHLVQSTSADLTKTGMLRCSEWTAEAEIPAVILLTVHDEVVFEMPVRWCVPPILRGLRDRMADHGGVLGLPTPVDVEIARERWSEKTRVEL